MNQGVYGNQSIGFNLNNGGENQASYLNLNYLKRDGLDELNSSRNGALRSMIKQNAKTRTPGTQGFIGFGLNKDLKKLWNLSADTRINLNTSESASENLTLIQSIENQILSENLNTINNENRFTGLNQDLGLNYKNTNHSLD